MTMCVAAMAPPSSSSATTSVQVALRIRPPTNQDSTSIPARFQRTVIHANSSTSVSVEATSSTPAASGAAAVASATAAGPGAKKQLFSFDQVHDPSTTQHTLFSSTALPLVSRFLEGFNCTILAYGQTSSGKTFTMTGIDLDANPSDPNNGMGIIPRAVSTIFAQARQLKEERGTSWNYSVKGSFIEIYNEDLIDLLSMDDGAGGRREVQIREDKDGHIIWGGLREVNVKNTGEVMTYTSLIRKGTSIRRTNETDMNAQSSRSHAIFSLTLTQKKFSGSGQPPRSASPLPPGGRSPSRLARPGSMYSGPNSASASGTRVGSPTFGRPATPSFAAAMGRGGGLRPSSALGHSGDRISAGGEDEVGEWTTIVSKFHFVDLAGSERLKRTAAAGERIKEGISINSGLLALGNVISALGDPSRAKSHTATHVPYRDSKLTRLLQDSLGGNAHTLMIACVSPAEWNTAETVNTLKYANRARNIKNRVVVNEKEDGWDDIEWLQGTVTRLRKEAKALKGGGGISSFDTAVPDSAPEGAGKKVLAQMTELQNNYEDLRAKFVDRTEELTRLRRELGEKHRSGASGAISGTGKYEEIVGPVIEEYEKTISAMEAELSLNRAALRHTNEMVEEKEEELAVITERHSATELYVEELRSRVSKLSEREASTEAYVRDLEDKMRAYDETSLSSSESMTDLKREIARYRETDTHSAKYIVDLEARLSRSGESVVALQQSVEKLEKEAEERQEEVLSLQARLDALRQDGESWRNDLDQREAKVRELEIKMEEWEKKRQDAGDTRTRLGAVVGEVEAARRSIEIDLSSSATSSPVKELSEAEALGSINGHTNGVSSGASSPSGADPFLQKELDALQQTHNATLTDLSSVTTKYRDALREISDLAAQIQELKIATATVAESVADTTDSERPEKPVVKRRMTSGRLREASESQYNTGGRRLFFRQAASTESLHSRSLSQSQSLSQELSSARSRNHSTSSHGTGSSHSPSNSHSAGILSPRPNLSISLPNGLAHVTLPERSAISLEKEIMRLQEVLKEREAEISALEISLRDRSQSQTESQTSSPSLPSSQPAPHDLKLDLVNGHGDELPASPERNLSPQTINRFEHIRRSMQFYSENGVIQQDHDAVSATDSAVSDTDESLDRLNELMLSMAQKESSHRETVDGLTKDLTQTRRQLDELTTLSRDQALNMSTEFEALREKHGRDLEQLQEIQQRESALIESLSKTEAEHAAAMEDLRISHVDALKHKQGELDALLSQMKEEHESALSSLRDEVSVASAALEKAIQTHEQAFGKLRFEHEEELRSKLQEANDTLARAREEHESTLSKTMAAHAEEIKQKDSQATTSIQQTEEDYYNALTKLRSDHAETTQRHNAEAAATLEKLKEEHAAELRMADMAKESLLSESQSSRGFALQELQDEHNSALSRKDTSYYEEIEKIKADHVRALADKDAGTEIEVGKLRAAMAKRETAYTEELEKTKADHAAALSALHSDHASALSLAKDEHAVATASVVTDHASKIELLRAEHEDLLAKLKDEHKFEAERLNTALVSLQNESSGAASGARAELDAAIQSQKEQQSALLEDITHSHQSEIEELKADHEKGIRDMLKVSEEKITSLLEAHTAETLKLRSQHQQEISELNNSIVALQEQHKASLEDVRSMGEKYVNEATQGFKVTLGDLEDQHSKEAATLRKENELLVQELEAHKAAAEDFLLKDQARREQEAQVEQKDGTIRTIQEKLTGVESERDTLASELAKLKAEFEQTRKEQSLLVQEASKRESLVVELERHRSVLAEMQENLQKVKDEKDTLQTEKGRSDTLLRELQAQIARSASPPNGRPNTERNISFNRIPGAAGSKLPPPTPPPSVPPPPAPRSIHHDLSLSSTTTATSSGLSSSSRDSQNVPDSPATSLGNGSSSTPIPASVGPDPKAQVKLDEQTKQLEEQEAMIKTLNKQLTHCESDLQTHMDLVGTLETSLGDSEKNLRKARMHATELARERDRLNVEIEGLRKELTDTKREVVNVRQSIVEEKQSYEQRLDEERKAKERARQQLDSRMEELSKRKSKFALPDRELGAAIIKPLTLIFKRPFVKFLLPPTPMSAQLSSRAAALIRPNVRALPRLSTVRFSSNIPMRSPKTLSSFSMEGKALLVVWEMSSVGLSFSRTPKALWPYLSRTDSEPLSSGCTTMAIVDLKESEAKEAARELAELACVNSDLKAEDVKIIGIECDVSSELSVQRAYAETLTAFGRVDSVVASAGTTALIEMCLAGIVENYAAFDYPFDRIKRLYDINVHGAFFTAREAARNMIPQGGGSIVLVASMSANIVNIPQPQTPYNASKAGKSRVPFLSVRHMASSLAVEWAKKNVRVNVLSPGYMATKLTRTILNHDPELKKTWESLTPMGRIGEPEDLSGAVVYLASDASRFMTGSEIRVDGGYFVHKLFIYEPKKAFLIPHRHISMSSSTTSTTSPSTRKQSGPAVTAVAAAASQTFEFTKRKRWADLLISELADTCIFVFSSNLKILYCNPAVNELLGWRETDVLDHDFTELINNDDQRAFRASFDESLAGRKELLAYTRMKCSIPTSGVSYPFLPMKEILFEIKGYPRFVVENVASSGCQCFFAMAKPYISRNITMLNTLMELKLENEHLQTKLAALKLKHHLSSSPSTSSSLYSTSSALFSHSQQHQHSHPDTVSGFYLGTDTSSPLRTTFDGSSSHGGGEEDVEEGQKKKKPKKVHPVEQYVCNQCGRTDSPEWRKGPMGPKTLCNACGLRWAKQMRRTDDMPDFGGGHGGGTGAFLLSSVAMLQIEREVMEYTKTGYRMAVWSAIILGQIWTYFCHKG
ncbi:hypothetical protein D9757_005088 [Collybiopsis confluens]|uniref:Uncharacterized protein n=1 Tax=Collybiopsis confluens TaxID=2823264 RepID=A0A8H5MCM4_9AGAR|nr:hypothetical protein D9757_005088 [Collybiopsis confluens]